jgi:hypothetical protein
MAQIKHRFGEAAVWKKRFVSGLRFSDAAKVGERLKDFSRWL